MLGINKNKMNFPASFFGYLISIPARMKGMKFGKNSFIGPRYDLSPMLRGVILGNDVIIGRNAWLDISTYTKGGEIIIGDGTQIGRNVMISACKKIEIGKKCLFSFGVSLLDHDHKFEAGKSPLEIGISEGKEIEIGDNCFVGAHSFILKGVKLGKNCVVGAGSVVIDSFGENSIIAGNPAKLIRTLQK